MRNLTMVEKKGLFSGVKEFFELFGTNLAVKKRNFFEFCKVMVRYYTTIKFLRIDQALNRQYWFKNAYQISKEFLKRRKEENIYAYGETPLTTLEQIMQECQVKSSDRVFELGCGKGRTCFWMNAFLHCTVIGVDFVPAFISKAEKVKNAYKINDLEFRCEDILETDLKGATVIYLYGTCYEPEFIEKLIERFRSLPSGTKILTISYPLTDYTTSPLFEVMKRFEAEFTWGTADVYLQQRK